MNPVRKFIGLMIIIFIAVPALFVVIWAVGITQAVVSPEFLSEFPKEIIQKIPDLLDEVAKEVDREYIDMDEDERAWLKAFAKSGVSTREMLEKSGFSGWLENELTQSLTMLGEMLKGKLEPGDIVLDLRPLKHAIQSEAFNQYFIKIVENLPYCEERGLDRWKEAAFEGDIDRDLPACRPSDPEIVTAALRNIHENAAREIPDEVDILEDVSEFPHGINISRFVVSITFILFLFPILFIMGGAVIADSSGQGFLRWTGLSTLIGGLLALGGAYFINNIIPWSLDVSRYHYFDMQLHDVLADKFGEISHLLFGRIFSPVIHVAGIVCVVGLIIFALSFVVSSGRELERGKHVPRQEETPPKEEGNTSE